jgi:hypothetical protein
MNKFPDRASTEDLEGRRKPRELRAVMPKANTGVARGSNPKLSRATPLLSL